MDGKTGVGREILGRRMRTLGVAMVMGVLVGCDEEPAPESSVDGGTSAEVATPRVEPVLIPDAGFAFPEGTTSLAGSGVNDWGCRPSAAHPRPIVLAHGLGATDQTNWFFHGPRLVDAGYCVFAVTYGTGALGPFVGGLESMRTSAAELGSFVDAVLVTTGASKVDLVGHSEGTTVPAYYLKFLGGAAEVENFVGFGANYGGTTLGGLSTLVGALTSSAPGLAELFRREACAACLEYMPGSEFLVDLAEGGVAVPGPHYTNIVSERDIVVVPYTSGVLVAPNVTNVVLQDVCPRDSAGHLGMAIDPNVTSLILRALDPAGAPPFRCRFFTTLGL